MNDNTKQFRRNCARQCPAAMSIRPVSGFGRTFAKASAPKSKSGRAASLLVQMLNARRRHLVKGYLPQSLGNINLIEVVAAALFQ